MMYSYKIFRLIIIIFIITYFIGCFWWALQKINSEEDIANRNTFITANDLDEIFLGPVPDKCKFEECQKIGDR